MSDIAQLRAAMREAARKATGETQGRWSIRVVRDNSGVKYFTHYLCSAFIETPDGSTVCGSWYDDVLHRFYANHIALANPANVLRLLDALDRAENRAHILSDALHFYADAKTYFATTLISDPPCGEIADDYDVDPVNEDMGPRLGKTAREALLRVEQEDPGDPVGKLCRDYAMALHRLEQAEALLRGVCGAIEYVEADTFRADETLALKVANARAFLAETGGHDA